MIREVNINSNNPFSKRIEYLVDNECIGYLDYSLIYDRMEIDNFLVNSLYRNKGIGNKLMMYFMELAKKLEVENITLEVRKSNNIAINLYKKYGFVEVAVRKYYYGDEDGILMEMKVK